MNNELHNAIMLFQKEKGISADVLCEKICLAVSTAAKKEFGIKDGDIICTMDPATYDISIFNRKTVTDDVLDPDTEISIEDAQKYKKGVCEGDTVDVPLKMENLGRIAAQSVKHTIRQNVRNYEHDREYRELQSKNNEIVTAKVLSVNPVTGDAAVEIAKTEALLPKKEQIPGETFGVGDFVKIYIVDVIETTKGPKVLLSRTNTGLVRRLFEQEVPEIYDGTVIIKCACQRDSRHARRREDRHNQVFGRSRGVYRRRACSRRNSRGRNSRSRRKELPRDRTRGSAFARHRK